MVKHCSNCYCEPVTICFGIHRKSLIRALYGIGMVIFIALAIMMGNQAKKNKFVGWTDVEHTSFFMLLVLSVTCFSTAFVLELCTIRIFVWSVMCGIYAYFLDFLGFVGGYVRITLQSIRAMHSRPSESAEPQSSATEIDSDEAPPPLPPRRLESESECVPEGENPQLFQKLTPEIDHEACSSGKPRTKKQTPREKFRQKMDRINLKAIEEDCGSRQDLPHLEIPLAVLLKAAESSSSTVRETSFSSDSDTSELEEKAGTSGIRGIQGKQNIPETSSGYVDSEKQEHTLKEAEKKRESPKKLSAATYVAPSTLQANASMSGNEEIKKMQKIREQTSATGFSDLERQAQTYVRTSGAGSTILERQERESVAEEIENKQEGAIATGFFAAERRGHSSATKGILKKPEKREQTSATGYVGFSELRREVRTPGIQVKSLCQEQNQSGFERQAREESWIKRIQKEQKRQGQTLGVRFHGLERQSSGTETQDIPRDEKTEKQTSSAGPLRLLSAMQRISEAPYAIKKSKKTGKTPEEIYESASGLAPNFEHTSAQGTEIRRAEDEEHKSMQTSSKDNSSASPEGVVSNEAQETGTFSSLNLSGGGLVVNRQTEGGESRQLSDADTFSSGYFCDRQVDVLDLPPIVPAVLNLSGGSLILNRQTEGAETGETSRLSDTNPCGSGFIYDQPEEVLDLSHIEVPIAFAGNEAESSDES